jgi:hypothetical protein
MPLPYRLVQPAFADRRRTAWSGLDIRDHRRRELWLRKRPDQRVETRHADRRPDIEQRRATAQIQRPAERVADPQRPVRIGPDLKKVICCDVELPGLRVVD